MLHSQMLDCVALCLADLLLVWNVKRAQQGHSRIAAICETRDIASNLCACSDTVAAPNPPITQYFTFMFECPGDHRGPTDRVRHIGKH